MTPRHETARAWARAGTPIFPCRPGGKEPATGRGFYDATTDLAQIDAWWSVADYNVALCPEDAGLFVLDPDPPDGTSTLATLELEHGLLPATYTVLTPRGGQHLYFKGTGPSTVGERGLGTHVDTRGVGGYVLVPPSIVDGKPYTVLHDRLPADLPAWIIERLARPTRVADSSDVGLDGRTNLDRARHLVNSRLRAGGVAVSGHNGNDCTYRLAAALRDLGISLETALGLLLEEWNGACVPPWPQDELRVIVQNAYNYAQNGEGAWAITPSIETWGKNPAVLADLAAPVRPGKFHFYDEAEMERMVDPTWLIPNLLPTIGTALMVGPTQSYKSFLTLDISLSVVASRATFGFIPSPGLVFYAAMEGAAEIMRRRRLAWRLARGIEMPLTGFFVGRAPRVKLLDEVEAFRQTIADIARRMGLPVALIVFDTLTKMMVGLRENDAGDAAIYGDFCTGIAEEFSCCVLPVHHTGRDVSLGARGGSHWESNFDTVLHVRADNDSKAVEVRVQKHKDAERPAMPWTFQGHQIAGSLVFEPTTAAQHKIIMADVDEFSPKNVGHAINRKGWHSRANSGSTMELLIAIKGIMAMGDMKAIHQLERLAQGPLKAYCIRDDSGIWWLTPEPEDHQ